jgi:hypothetical protein
MHELSPGETLSSEETESGCERESEPRESVFFRQLDARDFRGTCDSRKSKCLASSLPQRKTAKPEDQCIHAKERERNRNGLPISVISLCGNVTRPKFKANKEDDRKAQKKKEDPDQPDGNTKSITPKLLPVVRTVVATPAATAATVVWIAWSTASAAKGAGRMINGWSETRHVPSELSHDVVMYAGRVRLATRS